MMIKGAMLVTPEGGFGPVYIHMKEGRIAYMGETKPFDAPDEVFDASGLYVSAGFVDIHVHGGGGADFADGTVEAFTTAAHTHMTHGTTALMPTLVACPEEEIGASHAAYLGVARLERGPRWLGLHIEGPFVAEGMRGALDASHLALPDAARLASWLERWPALARMTLAPELPGALGLIDVLSAAGRMASIGHTDAMYEDVIAAVGRGCTTVTHLYSAMSGLRRIQGYRHLGAIESALLLDRLDCEIIGDGSHLPPELLRLIVKCKGSGRLILVTDAMRAAGQLTTETILGSIGRGQRVIVEDGVAKLPDRTAFAGSIATADRLLRVMTREAGVPLWDAIGMLTVNPARAIGRPELGRLHVGGPADAVLFDGGINIKAVFVGGSRVEAG